jgi:hypothetical protein
MERVRDSAHRRRNVAEHHGFARAGPSQQHRVTPDVIVEARSEARIVNEIHGTTENLREQTSKLHESKR